MAKKKKMAKKFDRIFSTTGIELETEKSLNSFPFCSEIITQLSECHLKRLKDFYPPNCKDLGFQYQNCIASNVCPNEFEIFNECAKTKKNCMNEKRILFACLGKNQL